MRLWRAHGLGNDYLILESGEPVDAGLVRALCDRHWGVGGDGVLEPTEAMDADHGVRIWNPDGSIAEKSGNGLRIFARWLADRGAGSSFTVSTGHDVVTCWVDDEAITVAMGVARVEPERDLEVHGVTYRVVPVDLGNPHCVLFVDDFDGLAWRAIGAQIEVHPAFPNRTNVQFAKVTGPARMRARIWERGAGETEASGSSACAVVAAAADTGRISAEAVVVGMPGGQLWVELQGSHIRLRGPVQPVGRFEVDPRWRR